MTLYEIINIINNKGYVGITHRSVHIRWKEHLYRLRSNKHKNLPLQHAYNKYGENAFKFTIRATFNSISEMNKIEQEILEKEKNRLYNLAPGGNAFYHYIESKKKISNSQFKPVIGMNIKTGEIRKYNSILETSKDKFNCKSISGACNLSKCLCKNRSSFRILSVQGWVWMYEKDFTIEEMQKRREMARRGKIRLERPIMGKNIITGEIVKFISGNDLKRKLNVSDIHAACLYKANKTRCGFVWVYADMEGHESLLNERWKTYHNKYKRKQLKVKRNQ